MYKNFFKRLIDIIVSIIALIILLPVYLIISTLILCELKGPIFFLQERAGKNGKPFNLIKFRTMIHNFDKKNIEENNAVTKLGNFLRNTSLDEIPEFVNILYGHMSIVGPRPLHVKYVTRYNKKHKIRLNVKPGLTGLAQVSGRNSLSWSEKFDFDVSYVNKLSFIQDVKIILLTVRVIFARENINNSGEHMKEFLGYSDED